MRLYNRNIVRKRLDEQKRFITNDRDAIIWSIDTNNYYCLVKIQGSNTTIKAHYPRNWKTIPTWLKRGNAVRIRHRSGVQGYIEVVGNGRAIPTAVEGGNLPDPTTPTDQILTGMRITEYPTGGMNVYVTSGTYMIDGVVYYYTATYTGLPVMDDPAPMTMGSGTVMGISGTPTAISISSESAGYGRYDTICIGTDGVIDVLEGTHSPLSSEPSKRSVPSGHVLIGYLFIYGGMTAIPQDWIGVSWTAPAMSEMVLGGDMWDATDSRLEMAWDAGDSYPVDSFTLTVKDQYGSNYTISETATITMLLGTGLVGATASGSWASSASKTMSYMVQFYYQRDQTESPESHPLVQITVANWPSLIITIPIILLDSGGDPISS